MKDTAKLIFILTIICLVAALLLAWVNDLTAQPILEAERAVKMDAISKVLPQCDNEPDADKMTLEQDGKIWTFYIARKNNKFVGAAFEAMSSEGYGGEIRIMVGVSANGNVQAIEILEHKETPGLGANIDGDEFKASFANRSIEKTTWQVKKDHGDIAGITAATISSRAVIEAVKNGLDVYIKHQTEIIRRRI